MTKNKSVVIYYFVHVRYVKGRNRPTELTNSPVTQTNGPRLECNFNPSEDFREILTIQGMYINTSILYL